MKSILSCIYREFLAHCLDLETKTVFRSECVKLLLQCLVSLPVTNTSNTNWNRIKVFVGIKKHLFSLHVVCPALIIMSLYCTFLCYWTLDFNHHQCHCCFASCWFVGLSVQSLTGSLNRVFTETIVRRDSVDVVRRKVSVVELKPACHHTPPPNTTPISSLLFFPLPHSTKCGCYVCN